MAKCCVKTELLLQVIAATNRADILDPALMRSGRLDRKIEFPHPTEDARAKILQIHSRKMNVSPDVNFEELARSTDDFNAAQLKAVCVEAGMLALRRDATEVEPSATVLNHCLAPELLADSSWGLCGASPQRSEIYLQHWNWKLSLSVVSSYAVQPNDVQPKAKCAGAQMLYMRCQSHGRQLQHVHCSCGMREAQCESPVMQDRAEGPLQALG